jgi:hypothetical protein
VLGLMTLGMALLARGGLWGLWNQRVDAPWFALRRRLVPMAPMAPMPPDMSTPDLARRAR